MLAAEMRNSWQVLGRLLTCESVIQVKSFESTLANHDGSSVCILGVAGNAKPT
jgi:hypothetical protein